MYAPLIVSIERLTGKIYFSNEAARKNTLIAQFLGGKTSEK